MILKVFTQPDCPKCPAAKELVSQLKKVNHQLPVEEYDTASVEGLAEASFYTIMATPSFLLFDQKGKIIGDWRGQVPSLKELEERFRE